MKILHLIKPGSILKAIISPFAWIIDNAVGTSFLTCERCERRKEIMNNWWASKVKNY